MREEPTTGYLKIPQGNQTVRGHKASLKHNMHSSCVALRAKDTIQRSTEWPSKTMISPAFANFNSHNKRHLGTSTASHSITGGTRILEKGHEKYPNGGAKEDKDLKSDSTSKQNFSIRVTYLQDWRPLKGGGGLH